MRKVRPSSWIIAIGVAAIGTAMLVTDSGSGLDRALGPLRFAAVHRQASGKVAIVEMDAESVATIKRYPWSRTNYAHVVDRLRAAGAASIVFDVDFSSASDPAGDRDFAAALARSDGLVALPTFGQRASASEHRTIDSLPIPILRDHVALASVSIAPDPDGQVRTMPLATATEGTPRPSLSAFIAARSGAVDASFPIDMAIDPATIPRLSFVAVRDGRFDPARVRGRNILIGATAIEMGDRYGTPNWGVIPGVVVQALATETLLRGVPIEGSPWTPFLLALVAVGGIVLLGTTARILAATAAALAVLATVVLVSQHALLVDYPAATALAMILLAAAACLARGILGNFRTQRTIDEATGLPNARVLLMPTKDENAAVLAVAQIDNHDSLAAVLGTGQTGAVVLRVAERLALIGLDAQVYRTADRQLAFRLPADQPCDDTLEGLRAILLQPVEVAGRRVDVSISVGVASGPASTVDRLLVDATIAAEDARRADRFWRHAATDLGDLERSISLMGELDEALAKREIEVFYQPKFNLREDRITSVEALVRWRHATRGFVGPDLFVPLAERTNRIGPLTLYVVERVMRDVADWRQRHGDVTAAVNISAKLLSNAMFNAEIEALLGTVGVDPAALVFEVTESAAMSDPQAAVAALRHYRELGIAVSMDDYGTGQSTLTYLRELPLNELKIDRSFVQHAHRNRNDAVLVRSTIDLAHDLGLKVVAEGVEDAECLAFLRESGCDLIQGYFISRPVPLPAFLTLMAEDRRAAA